MSLTEGNGEKRELFSGLDLELPSDVRSLAVLGRSGSGKSTLLRILAGLESGYSGEYFYEGERLDPRPETMAKYRAHRLGFVTQSPFLLAERKVIQNVMIGNVRSRDVAHAQRCLRDVGLGGYERRKAARLSGGEAQRVAIARALYKDPRVILADEPTGSLDADTEDQILTLFGELMARGTRVILTTHSERVADWCDTRRTISNLALVS